MSDGRFSDKGIGALTRLPGLQHVSLARTHLSDKGIEALSQIGTLESLNLDYVPVTDQGIEALAKLPSSKNSVSITPTSPTRAWRP